MVLYVAPGGGPPRAAWVTGRRVGNAVVRNRARRVLREAWRTVWPRVQDGVDVVLVARGPFGDARTADLVEEIEELLTQAQVMRR